MLALAYKEFGKLDAQACRDLKREDVECDLVFAGFLIISCPMKPDSKSVIKEIVKSSHKVAMITGDNPLTACHVAKELRFTRKTILVLTPEIRNHENKRPEYVWISINEDVIKDIDLKNHKKLVEEYDLAITGEGLQYLNDYEHEYFLKIVPYIAVYARFAPKQKEFIITTLKSLGMFVSYCNFSLFTMIHLYITGYFVLMCGDGTNDVGALKHADVGVSILSNVITKKKKSKLEGALAQPPLTNAAVAPTNNSIQNRIRASNDRQAPGLTARERAIARHRDTSQAMLNKVLKEMDEDQVQIVKLGDASIAAPFTSKSSSINCGKE